MQSRWSFPATLSTLRGLLGRLFFDAETAQFLKDRNARLTIQEGASQSFYTVKVLPETYIGTNTAKLLFRIKLLNPQSIQVSVYNQTTRQTMVNITVPFEPTSDSLNLNLGDIHLKMDLDESSSLPPRR